MSSVIVCPNCRSTLSPCALGVTCPMPVIPLSPMPCQGCHQGIPGHCLSEGMVPHFPMPYVCRHWLQVSRHSTPCTHGHFCGGQGEAPCQPKPPSNPFSPPCQPKPPSSNPFLQPPWGPVSPGDTVPKMAAPPPPTFSKEPLSKCCSLSSRGGSPEGTLILPPDVVLSSANGFPFVVQETPWTKEDDARVLADSKEDLEESGWYYGSLSWQEAAALLANTAEGTFLIRNSSSSHCPYALSVQTPQGPTSIRIEYEKGKFWLACEKKGVTPQLGSVIQLVEFYRALALSRDPSRKEGAFGDVFNITTMDPALRHVWVDHHGKVFSPITVIRPLKKNPPSLQHICRLATRGLSLPQIASLPLPLRAYLEKYKHTL